MQVREKDLKELISHYHEHRQYEEARVIENELRDALAQIEYLTNKYPHLGHSVQHEEATENKDQQEEHKEEVDHQEQPEETPEETHQPLPDEPQTETQQDTPAEAETETKVEEQPKSLQEYITEYDTIENEITELDAKIDQLAAVRLLG